MSVLRLIGATLLIAQLASGRVSAQGTYTTRVPLPAREVQFNTPGALPPQIASMPDVTAQMKVVQRRSQLVIARSNITRYLVADPSIIDVVPFSPTEYSVLGLALGTTTLALWFDNSPDPLIYLVEVIKDSSVEERARNDYGKLEQKLAVLFPNSKVYLIPLSGKIIVKGRARDSQEAALILQIIRGEVINQNGSLAGPQPVQPPGLDPNVVNPVLGQDLASSYIVNMLTVPGDFQIALRVRVAELNRSMLRRMGVNISAVINDGAGFFSTVMTGGAAAIGGAAATGASTGGSTLNAVFSNGDISAVIDWLAANGTTKILAEPTIVTLSGHPASFLSGGEFAVPTIVGIGGAQGQQTSFRGFGVSVNVTPTLIDKDLIRVQIQPEFSQVNRQNSSGGILGTNTRRVSTTVELREGQTIALAGLLSHQAEVEVDRIPYLGEIPLIGGLLFNSKRASQDEKELLILVSPEIVRPMEPDEVPPLPGYEVTHPDDCQLYWHAMTEGGPDQSINQLLPFGNGNGQGMEVGYSQYNPPPASPGYAPAATHPFGYPPAAGPLGPGGPMSRYPVAPNTARQGATPTPMGDRSNLRSPTPIPNRTSSSGAAAGPSAGRYGGYQPITQAGGFTPPSTNGSGQIVPAGYTVPQYEPSRAALPRR